MKISQPNFRKVSQPICIRSVWFLAVGFTRCAPWYKLNSFVTMAAYWVSVLSNIKAFSGHLWCSIFIFANGTIYPWSSMHINRLARVCGLESWKSLTFLNQVGRDWKRLSCHGNRIFYNHRCVTCRTISLPSFNSLCSKLVYLCTWYNIGLSVWHIQSPHLHILQTFTDFSNLNWK